jgi:hypothetical protein
LAQSADDGGNGKTAHRLRASRVDLAQNITPYDTKNDRAFRERFRVALHATYPKADIWPCRYRAGLYPDSTDASFIHNIAKGAI